MSLPEFLSGGLEQDGVVAAAALVEDKDFNLLRNLSILSKIEANNIHLT